ncbi:MAG TPA: hypothetical protein VL485_31865 [Ktedonobacteraceae bacterium]|nr:hypothetical protein [Ktedonobacteraceae bacterium]
MASANSLDSARTTDVACHLFPPFRLHQKYIPGRTSLQEDVRATGRSHLPLLTQEAIYFRAEAAALPDCAEIASRK